MRKNVAKIAETRESVGPDFPLMIDCYMSLNPRYTIELAHRIEKYDIKWLEECLIPDDYEGWKEIKKHVSKTMFSTGEHEYTRYGFRRLLEDKSIDLLQPGSKESQRQRG